MLHILVVLYFRRRGRHPPEMLEFPRVELFALLLMIQPIAQSAASANLGSVGRMQTPIQIIRHRFARPPPHWADDDCVD
jgi:hypothetical protein